MRVDPTSPDRSGSDIEGIVASATLRRAAGDGVAARDRYAARMTWPRPSRTLAEAVARAERCLDALRPEAEALGRLGVPVAQLYAAAAVGSLEEVVGSLETERSRRTDASLDIATEELDPDLSAWLN